MIREVQQVDSTFRPAQEGDRYQYELPGPGAILKLTNPKPGTAAAKRKGLFVGIEPPIIQIIFRHPQSPGEEHLVKHFPPVGAQSVFPDGRTEPPDLRTIIQRESGARGWQIEEALAGLLSKAQQ